MKHFLLTLLALLAFTGTESARPLSPFTLPTPSCPAAIDVYRMASVIEAEAKGEPCECKELVGEVLMNRARAQKLTIAKSAIVGIKRKKPSPESIEIARKILSSQHVHRLEFFYNPDLATDFRWLEKVSQAKKIRCGGHLFF